MWLHGAIRTSPMSTQSRVQAGVLLRSLQQGELPPMPHSRPMPSIGRRCHELRIDEPDHSWRIVYRIDPDAILILAVFDKTTRETPLRIVRSRRDRLRRYDSLGP